MNTGFVRPAVATVLTACGIETIKNLVEKKEEIIAKLQQYLPLAVLKPSSIWRNLPPSLFCCNSTYRLRY